MEIDYRGNDTCILLPAGDSAVRVIEVVGNDVDDTMMIGLGVVPGKFTGKLSYLQWMDKTDGLLYAESFYDAERLEKTDRICLNYYRHSAIRAKGRLKIKLRL